MAYLVLSVLGLSEIGFLIYGIMKSASKRNWAIRRLIADAIQAVLFAVMLVLPGVDTSFRFKGLIFLLVIRIAVTGLLALINRKKVEMKKLGGKIGSLVISLLLITLAMIPAFLFNDYKGRPLHGEYGVKMCHTILVDENRVEEFEDDGSYREVPVYFFYPDEDGVYPLVLFSHGAFGYYQSNASTYMELASHGYVVVSLDHPYHSFFTKDTDGKTITVDPEFMNDVMSTEDKNEEVLYEMSKEWMKLRVDDVNFVLDEIIGGNEEIGPVLKMIDTERIGLMGHSMGGATAVEVAIERDDIEAVIDIDGTMLGSIKGAKDGKFILEDVELSVPILEFENENAHKEALQAIEEDYPYPNNMIRENADVYWGCFFEGAKHMDYTDLPLFSPALAKMLGSGDVDNEYMMDTVNSLAVEFYDCYLKGEGQFSCEESYQGVR